MFLGMRSPGPPIQDLTDPHSIRSDLRSVADLPRGRHPRRVIDDHEARSFFDCHEYTGGDHAISAVWKRGGARPRFGSPPYLTMWGRYESRHRGSGQCHFRSAPPPPSRAARRSTSLGPRSHEAPQCPELKWESERRPRWHAWPVAWETRSCPRWSPMTSLLLSHKRRATARHKPTLVAGQNPAHAASTAPSHLVFPQAARRRLPLATNPARLPRPSNAAGRPRPTRLSEAYECRGRPSANAPPEFGGALPMVDCVYSQT